MENQDKLDIFFTGVKHALISVFEVSGSRQVGLELIKRLCMYSRAVALDPAAQGKAVEKFWVSILDVEDMSSETDGISILISNSVGDIRCNKTGLELNCKSMFQKSGVTLKTSFGVRSNEIIVYDFGRARNDNEAEIFTKLSDANFFFTIYDEKENKIKIFLSSIKKVLSYFNVGLTDIISRKDSLAKINIKYFFEEAKNNNRYMMIDVDPSEYELYSMAVKSNETSILETICLTN